MTTSTASRQSCSRNGAGAPARAKASRPCSAARGGTGERSWLNNGTPTGNRRQIFSPGGRILPSKLGFPKENVICLPRFRRDRSDIVSYLQCRYPRNHLEAISMTTITISLSDDDK